MPVMSPRGPSDEVVQKVFDDVFSLLQIKYKYLNGPELIFQNAKGLRAQRINQLKQAVHDIIELDIWESW